MQYPAPAGRRRRLAQAIARHGGGLAILPTAAPRLRNGDNEHPFRACSHFQHLTGFEEPDAWLLLDAGGHATLLCRERDPARELWDGVRLGPEGALATLGLDEALPLSTLDRVVVERLRNQPAVWYPFGAPDGLAARIDGWLATLRALWREEHRVPAVQRDLAPLLGELRLRKEDEELQAMRRAAAISAAAHQRVMRYSAAHFRARPDEGLPEYVLEAELLHEFRRCGAASPAYQSIVAAGANACVLHHPAGATPLHRGELCLVDAGAEWQGYASDITRCFPADGRFSGPQRALYGLVQAAQQAAIDATRPGARKIDAHWAAVRVLTAGLIDEGLLDRRLVGDVDAAIDSAAYRRFYMHGTGHWLGRDVHDVGDTLALDEPLCEQRDGEGGRVLKHPSRVLEPGMVLTVEPGLYVRPAADVPEHFWNIGIRLEDDAVVTATGCELISRGVPVDPDEIEALMRG